LIVDFQDQLQNAISCFNFFHTGLADSILFFLSFNLSKMLVFNVICFLVLLYQPATDALGIPSANGLASIIRSIQSAASRVQQYAEQAAASAQKAAEAARGGDKKAQEVLQRVQTAAQKAAQVAAAALASAQQAAKQSSPSLVKALALVVSLAEKEAKQALKASKFN
jgi:hypothetical protein